MTIQWGAAAALQLPAIAISLQEQYSLEDLQADL
jgi:hypothetical protein